MLPWAEMFRAAMARGLSPQAFWALSLREWLWLAGEGDRGLDRAALTRLMKEHPDG